MLLAVFLGGAIGSVLRVFVYQGAEGNSLTEPETALIATTIVNLVGAMFLGHIHAVGSKRSLEWSGFWGTGLAGGFTTMSGLTLVTQAENLGPFGNGAVFWLAVALQLLIGVLAYWLGRSLGDRVGWQKLIGGKP